MASMVASDAGLGLLKALQELRRLLSKPKVNIKTLNDCIQSVSSCITNMQKAYPRRNDSRDKLLEQIKSSIADGVKRLPEDNLLDIAWDLDACLIKSELVTKELEKDVKLNTTVDEKTRTCHSIVHVDDDMMRFRTVTRPWAHFILCMLRPFCRHWIFTSATRGYMKNVVSLFEPPTKASYRVFEDHRLSCSDFPKRFLRAGKPLSRLHFPKCTRAAVLVDDQPRYHLSQPTRGLLVPGFRMDDTTESALLQCVPLLLRCVVVIRPPRSPAECSLAVSTVLVPSATNEYWDGLVISAAKLLRKRNEGEVVNKGDGGEKTLTLKEWGQHSGIPDKIWTAAMERIAKKEGIDHDVVSTC